jgi:hypothetical protein
MYEFNLQSWAIFRQGPFLVNPCQLWVKHNLSLSNVPDSVIDPVPNHVLDSVSDPVPAPVPKHVCPAMPLNYV